MKDLINKFIIFIISLALYITYVNSAFMVVPVLIVITISTALSYFEKGKINLWIFIIYTLFCFVKPPFLFFIPLICYDIILNKIKWLFLLSFLPLLYTGDEFSLSTKWLIISFISISYILKYRTTTLENINIRYNELRDSTKEMSMKLEEKNKELLEKQDYEINLATLTERNRIARDIHDNVGHMLSRSILQVGALLVTTKDENTKESLNLIKDTLSDAMNSIRSSVHDLHEESVDLKIELQKLINNFNFCPVEFFYDVDSNLEKNMKYCFIAVTKEALSNIIKHSNGTKALVKVYEHPAFYQLIIEDNGTKSQNESSDGIGLKNIKDRVLALNGNINITQNKGFRIFISVPKNNLY